LPQILKAGMK